MSTYEILVKKPEVTFDTDADRGRTHLHEVRIEADEHQIDGNNNLELRKNFKIVAVFHSNFWLSFTTQKGD